MIDPQNRIRLLGNIEEDHPYGGAFAADLEKKNLIGKYVSLIPLTDKVENLSLSGFSFDVEKIEMTIMNSLGISNQLAEERGRISFETGILIMVESKDNFS